MRALIGSLIMTAALLTAGVAATGQCDAGGAWMGGCATSNGTSLDVSGSRNDLGSSGPPSRSADEDSDLGDWSGPQRPEQNYKTDNCRGVSDRRCARAPLPRPPAESGSGVPDITIADLATFSPSPAQPIAEPGNVGIAGMPANFVANATTHTQTGTLFGAPVTVRFTPAGYDFHHGDGTTSTLATGGRTWAALGQPQFTATATSHVYRARGTYTADVTVHYTAEVDLGTGWFTVPGELTTPGPTQEIRVFEAHTALVAHTCTENPTAPGC